MSRIISLVARVTVNEAVSIHPHYFSYPFLLETPCQPNRKCCCSLEPQIMNGESLPQSKDDASLIAVYPSKQPTMLPAHTHSPLSPLIAFSPPHAKAKKP
mmetsp:Transcript_23778/g.36804  ORF Transcript_23778/g.36804 Transcript_23778/m.36804 type:complete len:100 (-) Transcript_23778:576-875(-)